VVIVVVTAGSVEIIVENMVTVLESVTCEWSEPVAKKGGKV